MENPFVNDPFSLVWKAFRNMYPEKSCEVYWLPDSPADENGEIGYGYTDFREDGAVIVAVSSEIPVANAVEVFAHELAHAAVGIADEHGQKWKAAFDAIFQEYNRIASDLFGGAEQQNG